MSPGDRWHYTTCGYGGILVRGYIQFGFSVIFLWGSPPLLCLASPTSGGMTYRNFPHLRQPPGVLILRCMGRISNATWICSLVLSTESVWLVGEHQDLKCMKPDINLWKILSTLNSSFYERNLIEAFPKLTIILNTYVTLSTVSWESEDISLNY